MHYPSFVFRHHKTFIPSLTRLDPCHFYTSPGVASVFEMTEVELIKLLILIELYNNPHHINKTTQDVIIIEDEPIHCASIPNFFDECFISNCLVFRSIKIPLDLTKLFICQIIKNFTLKTRTGHINAHYGLVVFA